MSTALACLTPSPTGVPGTGPAGSNPRQGLPLRGWRTDLTKWQMGEFLNGKWLHHLPLAFPGLSNPGLELSTFPHHRLRILRKRDSDAVEILIQNVLVWTPGC